jgi:hypothetical protein
MFPLLFRLFSVFSVILQNPYALVAVASLLEEVQVCHVADADFVATIQCPYT